MKPGVPRCFQNNWGVSKCLSFETRQLVRAEVAEAVKAGELKKKVIYPRLAAKHHCSVKTIERTDIG